MFESRHQLEVLLEDPDFFRIVLLATREVMCREGVDHEIARGFVLWVLCDTPTLACIEAAWRFGRAVRRLGLAKLLVRRRVLAALDHHEGWSHSSSFSQAAPRRV